MYGRFNVAVSLTATLFAIHVLVLVWGLSYTEYELLDVMLVAAIPLLGCIAIMMTLLRRKPMYEGR